MSPRRQCALVTVVVVATALLAACSDDTSPAPSAPPTATSGPAEALPTPPDVVAPAPLELDGGGWSSTETGMSMVDIHFQGDLAVGVGDRGKPYWKPDRVMVVDARTGKEQWSAKPLERSYGGGLVLYDTFVAVGPEPGDPLVVDLYQRGYGASPRVVGGLDPDDGSLVWTWRAPRPRHGDDLPTRPVGAAAGVVVVAAGPTTALMLDEPLNGSPARTFGLDLRTGRRLWTTPGLLGGAVAGDRVVTFDGGRVTGVLDLATGRVLWRPTREDAALLYGGVADGLLVLWDLAAETSRVLDLDTGAPLLDVPTLVNTGSSSRVSTVPSRFVAWQDGDLLMTYAAGEPAPGSVRVTETGAGVGYVFGDFVMAYVGSGRRILVDRLGHEQDDLGGVAASAVSVVDDRYVVARQGEHDFQVLRRG